MNPVKCPNCRLSLPQNWAGANDANAKCPYCGKPLAGKGPTSTQPPVSTPSQPVPPPKPASGSKTILWGVGAPIPGMPVKPSPETGGSGSIATAATTNRPIVQSPSVKVVPAKPSSPPTEVGSIDVDVDDASSQPPAVTSTAASKPSGPAPTVMFDEAVPLSGGVSTAKPERPAPEPAPAATMEEPVEEPEPPAEPSPKPVVNKSSKFKGKPIAKKGFKSRPGTPSRRPAEGDEDDDEGSEKPKKKSSKTGLIIFLILLLCGVGIVLFFALRHRGPVEEEGDEGKSKTTSETSLGKPEPTPSEESPGLAKPAEPAKPVEKPARPEKPAPAEKPARAEKPSEKSKPEPAEAPAESKTVKLSEEDYRRANEAYQRGNNKLFQGNTAEAITEFNQALKWNPKDSAIHRGLGLAYAQSNKPAEAIKHLKLYLKASPKANDRAIIEKRISQLKGM
jgi:flagellar basal body-associated protein FliL